MTGREVAALALAAVLALAGLGLGIAYAGSGGSWWLVSWMAAWVSGLVICAKFVWKLKREGGPR